MPGNNQLLTRLEENARQADETIALLEKHLELLERQAGSNLKASYEKRKELLKKENQSLQENVGYLKTELENIEVQNGLRLVSVPKKAKTLTEVSSVVEVKKEEQVISSNEQKQPTVVKEKKKNGKKEKSKETKVKEQPVTDVVDISRLDLRIGHIIDVQRHPDADTLYVEQMDLGEHKPRTIVTGVVKHVPIEKMQDRMVMVLCNLKPVKMRGIFSQGMVMCASSPDLVEILDPPPGCVPGDLIECEGYPRTPDDQLNPKKKIFEKIQPDLHVNSEGIATYKGAAFIVAGKPGYFKSQAMKNSNIK